MVLSLEKKKFITWAFPAVLGFISLVIMLFDYVESFVTIGSVFDESNGYNGYELLNFFDFEKYGAAISVTQIMILVVSIILLTIGVLCILKTLKIVVFPDAISDIPITFFVKVGMIVHTALNLILLVLLIMLTSSYTEKMGFGTLGFRFCGGFFFLLALSLILTAGYIFWEYRYSDVNSAEENNSEILINSAEETEKTNEDNK